MSFATTMQSVAQRAPRNAKLAWLRQAGWINPRSGRAYDEFGAMCCESLRSTFVSEAARLRRAKDRASRGTRPRRGRPYKIEPVTVLA